MINLIQKNGHNNRILLLKSILNKSHMLGIRFQRILINVIVDNVI